MRIYQHYSITSAQQDERTNRYGRTDESSQGTTPFSAFLQQETQDFMPEVYDEDDDSISAVMPGRVPPMPPVGMEMPSMQRPEGIPPMDSMKITEA